MIDEIKALACFAKLVKLARLIGVRKTAELLAKYAYIDADEIEKMLKARLRKGYAKEIAALRRAFRPVYFRCTPETFMEIAARSPKEAVERCVYIPGVSTDTLVALWDSGMFWEYICQRVREIADRRYSRRTRSMLRKWASRCTA